MGKGLTLKRRSGESVTVICSGLELLIVPFRNKGDICLRFEGPSEFLILRTEIRSGDANKVTVADPVPAERDSVPPVPVD